MLTKNSIQEWWGNCRGKSWLRSSARVEWLRFASWLSWIYPPLHTTETQRMGARLPPSAKRRAEPTFSRTRPEKATQNLFTTW